MTESMIERVARALATKHYASRFAAPPDGIHVRLNVEANWMTFYDDATTSIEAMRQPTEKMVDAGAVGSGEDSVGVAIGAWEAMIDAALKEPML